MIKSDVVWKANPARPGEGCLEKGRAWEQVCQCVTGAKEDYGPQKEGHREEKMAQAWSKFSNSE